MSEIVKLPREVAEAIDHCRNTQISNRVILRLALDERGSTALRDTLYKFAESNFDTLVSAVYGQYEVEQTPEDKVAEYITRLRNTRDHSYTDPAKQRELNIEVSGAVQVLEYLNIKIEGVNA